MKETKHFKRKGRQRLWAVVLALVLTVGSIVVPTAQVEAAEFDSQKVNYLDVLGEAQYFGILAREFTQITHMQTNYAVIDYEASGQRNDPDLIDGWTIPFYVANINSDEIQLGSPLHNEENRKVQYVFDTSEENKSKIKCEVNNVDLVVDSSKGYDGRVAVLNNMMKHIQKQSSDMSKVTTGSQIYNLSTNPVADFNQHTMDVSTNENKVVYVNIPDSTEEKSYKNLLRTGTLTLKKRADQVVVFNIAGEEVSLRMFKVDIVDKDGKVVLSGDSSSAGGSGAQNQFLMEYVDKNIIWNLYEATDVEFRNTAGTFLIPNEKAYTKIQGTSTGWLMTAGSATNPSGEWHFPYQIDSYVEPGTTPVTPETPDDPPITPEPALNSIKISKKDMSNKGGAELEGADMALFVGRFDNDLAPSTTPVVTWTSGTAPYEIEGSSLSKNTDYTLREVSSPSGYNVATNITFKIDNDGNIVPIGYTANSDNIVADERLIVMFDEAKATTPDPEDPENPENPNPPVSTPVENIKISKKAVGGGDELAGAMLWIYEKDTQKVVDGQWESGTEPHVVDGSRLKKNTAYVLEEVAAPKGYKIASKIEFRIDDEGNVVPVEASASGINSASRVITMVDDAIPDNEAVKISKRSLGDGSADAEELPGATLQLIENDSKDGTVVAEWKTTNEPKTFTDLKTNTSYILREIATPNDGKYEIASDIKFTTDANGKVDKDSIITSVALAGEVNAKSDPENNLIVMLDRVKGSISKNDTKAVKISKRSLGDGKDFDELPGAKLELYLWRENGILIDEWVSGSEPHEISSNVLKPSYEYVLVEKQTPDDGKYEYASSVKFKLNSEYEVIEVEPVEATASGADVQATGAYSSKKDRLVVMFDKVKTVAVTVDKDGVITYPDGTEIRPDGTEIRPDGTVKRPDGTIEYEDGGIKKPGSEDIEYPDGGVKKPGNDYIEYPNGNKEKDYPAGTKVYPNGDKEKDYPAGTVEYPDGGVKKPGNDYVEYPNGNKEKDYPAGTIVYPDGNKEKDYPAGTIVYPDGGVKKPGEAVTYPNGGVKEPDGSVTYPDGGVKKPGSEDIEYPDGSKKKPDGTIETATGTIIKPDGSIDYPDGSKVDKDGNFIDKDGTVYKPNPANPSNPTAPYDFDYDPGRIPEPDIPDPSDDADKDFMKEFKKKGSNKQDQKNADKALRTATAIKTGDESAIVAGGLGTPLTKLGAKNTSKSSKKLNSKLKAYRKTYKKQSKQIAGWVTINGTNIDYPVMYSGLKNNSKYLHKNIYGKEDTHGMIFASYLTTSRKISYNYIIYGHNMRDETMFGNLDNYGSPSFTKSHRYINVDTSKYNYVYEVVDVVRISCAAGSKDGMIYEKFAQIGKKKVYNQWKKQVAKCRDSNYKKPLGKYSNKDRLVILSTCEYTKDNGRLGLICKQKSCTKIKGK